MLASYERQGRIARKVNAEPRAGLHRFPHGDGIRLPLRLHRLVFAILDRALRRPVGLLPDEDAVYGRRGLQPRRGVDDVAGAMPSPSAGRAPSETSASPVFTPIRTWSSPSSTTHSRIASAARTARSGSSSCATGAAEERNDGVADELLHGTAEVLELSPQPLPVRPQERTDILGIHRFGTRREADEIGKEDGQYLSFLTPPGRVR